MEDGDGIYGESRHGAENKYGESRHDAGYGDAIYHLPATYLLRDCSLLRHVTWEIRRTTFQTEMDARPTAGSYRKARSALGS